ncbi:MAG: periplasmic heavy metal sensor [Rhizomicrobium sp.]
MPSPFLSQPPSAGLSRGWRVLIILSLCLNLLMLGAAGTLLWRWSAASLPLSRLIDGPASGPMHHGNAKGFGLGHGPLNPHVLASLAPEKRDAIRHLMDAHRPKMQALRQESFKARQAASDLMASDGYSSERFAAALDRVRLADGALEAEVLRIVNESVGLLSPGERRAVAKAQNESEHGPGDGHGPGMGNGMGNGGQSRPHRAAPLPDQ